MGKNAFYIILEYTNEKFNARIIPRLFVSKYHTPYTSNGFPLFHIIDKRCKINFYSYLLLFSAYLFSLTYYHLNAPGSVSLNYYTVHISLCTLLLKPSTTSNQGESATNGFKVDDLLSLNTEIGRWQSQIDTAAAIKNTISG